MLKRSSSLEGVPAGMAIAATLLMALASCFPAPRRPDKAGADSAIDGLPDDSGGGGSDGGADGGTDGSDGAGEDQDGDGISIEDGDCDDEEAEIHPGAEELCNDGIDQNCSTDCRRAGEIEVSELLAADLGAVFHDPAEELSGTLHYLGDLNADGYAELGFSAMSDRCARGQSFQIFKGPISPGDIYSSSEADNRLEGAGDRFVCGAAAGLGYIIVGQETGEAPSLEPGTLYLWPLEGDGDEGPEDAVGELQAVEPTGIFGRGIHFSDDLDGDGIEELLIPDWRSSPGAMGGAGALYMLSGADLPSVDADRIDSWAVAYVGGGENQYFGAAAEAGDTDDDGYNDLVITEMEGGPDGMGAVHIFHPEGHPVDTSVEAADQSLFMPAESGDHIAFGGTLKVGELSGEGAIDIVVGAYDYPSDDDRRGAVFLLVGPFEGSTIEIDLEADRLMTGAAPTESLGWILDLGDIDADGRQDLLTAVSPSGGYAGESENQGIVTYGPVGSTPDWQMNGPTDDDWYGYSTVIAGDMNGDGPLEVAATASDGDAWLFFGAGE